MNIINKVTSKVTGFVNEQKEKYEANNQLIEGSRLIELTNDIAINEEYLCEGNWKEYSDMCSYINSDYARLIDGLIPMNEIVLNIFCITVKKNNASFIVVLTNLRILVMDKQKYNTYDYSVITNFYLVSNGFMSSIININNIIMDIDVNKEELNIIYSLMTNSEYRNSIYDEKIKYLCGITPVYQRLNDINSGISIGQNNVIVFHDKKEKNYLCKYDEILQYEIMEDNTPVMKRKENEQSTSMPFSKKECMHMNLRVTLNNNQIFEITILEPTTFNSTYLHTNSTYMKQFNFTKEIMDKLDSMNDKLYRK